MEETPPDGIHPPHRRPRKVLLFPQLGATNPYLPLLASGLEAEGLSVSIGRYRRGPSLWRALWRHGRPDLIHLQWQHKFFVPASGSLWAAIPSTALFFFEWLTLRISGIRFVWTVHNIVNHEKRLGGWELFANRLLARCVDEILVHCEPARVDVAGAYRLAPESLNVVPHGHFSDCYPSAPPRGEARRDLDLPEKGTVFLFFGLIRGYKGVTRLIQAFRDLPGDNVRLVVAGLPRSEALAAEVRAVASLDPRVITRLEFLEDTDLVKYLSACDAVVLPYHDTLTSGAAVLAASYGRPLVMPALGCAKSFPPEMCVAYDPECEAGLRKALDEALQAPLRSMGEAAWEHVSAFAWESVARESLQVYEHAFAPKGVTRHGDTPDDTPHSHPAKRPGRGRSQRG